MRAKKRTETYEALKIYIQMNMDGLKDSVIQMLAGEGVRINTGTFSNDMTTFATKDGKDVWQREKKKWII